MVDDVEAGLDGNRQLPAHRAGAPSSATRRTGRATLERLVEVREGGGRVSRHERRPP